MMGSRMLRVRARGGGSGDDVVEAVAVGTLKTAPADATHSSTRSLAARHGVGRQTVSGIWRPSRYKPRRTDSSKLCPDSELVEKFDSPDSSVGGLCGCSAW